MKFENSMPSFENEKLMNEFFGAVEKAVRGDQELLGTLKKKIGPVAFLELYKKFILDLCNRSSNDFLSNILLTEFELDRAINVFRHQTNVDSFHNGFLLLIPFQAQPSDLDRKPELTIAFMDLSGESVLFGESRDSRIVDVLPSEFIQMAYEISQIENSNLDFYDNLKFQLNYYRELFNLDRLS